nr:hypothetical protein HK105_006728 [Polyrhizophydium stewartii]
MSDTLRQRRVDEPLPASAGAAATAAADSELPSAASSKSKSKPASSSPLSRGALPVLLLWAVLALAGIALFFRLPEPRTLQSPTELFFSETAARDTVAVLARDIGLRVVGTDQEDRTKNYILDQIEAVRKLAQANPTPHNFGVYTNVTNIIVRLSCGPECDKNALLLNSHYDTTVVSPGASDDGAGVAIMLEVLRIIAQTPKPLKNSIIFLFNGAEETLQDATHAFVTQHELAAGVRAVLNLESMGVKGKEILFQVNSDTLVDAYRHVPHPHAAVTSNDVFSTGLVLSDTDFRQFVQYGNLVGLDFAYYQNSYLYHTMLDVEENIEAGSLQHFGDNIVALTHHILFESSLENVGRTQALIYYDYLGLFFVYYSFSAATIVHYVLAVVSVAVAISKRRSLGLSILGVFWEAMRIARSLFISIVMAVITALLLTNVLGNPMSWFSAEWLPIVLFSGPIVHGLLHFSARRRRRSSNPGQDTLNERRSFLGTLVFWSIALVGVTRAGLGVSFLFSFHVACLLLGQIADTLLDADKPLAITPVSLTTYALSMSIVVPYAVPSAYTLLMLFVPLSGRIGTEAPVDIIVAVITGLAVFVSQGYLLIPVFHRLSRRTASRIMTLFDILSLVTIFVFSSKHPYDAMHPKRIGVEYMENVTSGDRSIFLAYVAPGRSHEVIRAVQKELDVKPVRRGTVQTDRDFGTIFPISHFLDNYGFNVTEQALAIPGATKPPQLRTTTTAVDPATGERNVTVSVYYPGYVWTVLSFDADVVAWSIAEGVAPRRGGMHHHTIRHIGGYGCNVWNMSMTVRGADPIWMEVSGVERDSFTQLTAEMHHSPRMSHRGMQWKWSDRWASASILSRVQGALPDWVAGMYMGVVVTNAWV